MDQIGGNATQETWGYLHPCRYVLHDRDSKFDASFRSALASGGVKTIQLPAKSPNQNAFAGRWVRSVKRECLSQLILFGQGSLSRVLTEYSRHYHHERNHPGKGNRLLFPREAIKCIGRAETSRVSSDSAAYLSTTSAPHEYFYRTATLPAFC